VRYQYASAFYFKSGTAADWLDKNRGRANAEQPVVEQWLAEFDRLKKLNAEIMKTAKATVGKPKPKRGARGSDH
jgi:hypothetical protein